MTLGHVFQAVLNGPHMFHFHCKACGVGVTETHQLNDDKAEPR